MKLVLYRCQDYSNSLPNISAPSQYSYLELESVTTDLAPTDYLNQTYGSFDRALDHFADKYGGGTYLWKIWDANDNLLLTQILELKPKSKSLCQCPMTILMTQGCTCGLP